MAENLRLEVVTPEKTVVSDDATIVMAPGVLGEFGVLVDHTPFLTSLKPGTLHYKDMGGKEHLLFVSDGFAEVLPDRVTILAESAERKEDIDIQRAEAARDRAEKRLASDEDIDFVRAKAALTRALQRIQLARA